MKCDGCRYFSMRAASDASLAPMPRDVHSIGVCRRYPPRMTRHVNGHLASVFPNVHREHGCGEYDSGVPL